MECAEHGAGDEEPIEGMRGLLIVVDIPPDRSSFE